jgi:uncharacterized protein YciI
VSGEVRANGAPHGALRRSAWQRNHAGPLVAEDFVVLGGPLGDGANVLLIVDAETDEAVHRRLAADPWTAMQLLSVSSIEPWEVLLGG